MLVLRLRSVMERLACTPDHISMIYFLKFVLRTLPSAQFVMSCNGSAALYMAVVFSHTGSPRHTTTTQKEKMASLRSHMFSTDSGGGCLCTLTASRGLQEDDAAVVSAGAAPVVLGEAMLPLIWSSCHVWRRTLGMARAFYAQMQTKFSDRSR